MTKSIRLAPPNSLIVVMDSSGGELPGSMNGGLVSASPPCVAIGTRAAPDGETTIVLPDEAIPATTGLTRAFVGELKTPSRVVRVLSTRNETLLETEVAALRTRLEIWVNHHTEPDDIRIVIVKPRRRANKAAPR